MDCPKCKSKTMVLETRGNERRRACLSCGHRFGTLERIDKRPPRRDYAALRVMALGMLERGDPVKAVALDLSIEQKTVCRWRRDAGR